MIERLGERQAVLLPVTGGVAVLAAATSMSEMIAGAGWLLRLVLVVAAIVATGMLLRALLGGSRHAAYASPLLALLQLAVLACVCVGSFTSTGVFGVFPGPSALGELGRLLAGSVTEIRVGRPPVPATPAILFLVVSSVGVVAVLVDLLVVEVRAPAVAGLMLLGVYAVPASLSDELLPWWSFALGGAAFALVLAADRARRHREWRGSVGLSTTTGLQAASPMTAVTGVALVVALVAGSAVTSIGTRGALPGETEGRPAGGAWGLNPFTKLRGELNQPDQAVELFRVRGQVPDTGYLRAVTLSRFDPRRGWRVGTVASGQQLPSDEVQGPPGTPGDDGRSRTVRLRPVHWQDNWLPLFGDPGEVSGLRQERWRWDPRLSAAFAKRPVRPRTYTERIRVRQPSPGTLRGAGEGTDGLSDPAEYTTLPAVDPQVAALARRLTENRPSTFDKARAVWEFLTSGQFSYSLSTPPPVVRDPVADFLFHGKQGFCEQFSSAMAVLLRAANVPVRVAVGFTPGTSQEGYRSVTTQDAHAWDEVYFPGQGWLPFDPTPLSDGRGRTPAYLQRTESTGSQDSTAGPTPTTEVPSPTRAPEEPRPDVVAAPDAPRRGGGGHWWPPLASATTLAAPGPALWVLGGLTGLAAVLSATVAVALRRSRRGDDR